MINAVTDATEFYTQFANPVDFDAITGEPIIYLANNYDDQIVIDATHTRGFPGNYTIKSVDDTAPSTVTLLALNGVSDLTFENIKFKEDNVLGYWGTEEYDDVANSLTGVADISIKGSTFEGYKIDNVSAGLLTGLDISDVNDPNHAYDFLRHDVAAKIGLRIDGSSNVDIDASTFTTFRKGINVIDSSSVSFTGNTITQMAADGIYSKNSDDILIDGNTFSDFRFIIPEGRLQHDQNGVVLSLPTTEDDFGKDKKMDHPDFIQLESRGDGQVFDGATITNNIFDSMTSAADDQIVDYENGLTGTPYFAIAQILMGPKENGEFANIDVSNNFLSGRQSNSIRINEADAATLNITNNTLVFEGANTVSADKIPKIVLTTVDGIAPPVENYSNNVAAKVNLNGSFLVGDNLFVNPDEYDDTFGPGVGTTGLPHEYVLDGYGFTPTTVQPPVDPEPPVCIALPDINDFVVTIGDETDETIKGKDALRDWIEGAGGNDTIRGRKQDDYLDGGDGDDRIVGQDGDDFIFGGAGNDKMYGGNGNDTFFATEGDDSVFGNNGDDVVVVGATSGTVKIFGWEKNGDVDQVHLIDGLKFSDFDLTTADSGNLVRYIGIEGTLAEGVSLRFTRLDGASSVDVSDFVECSIDDPTPAPDLRLEATYADPADENDWIDSAGSGSNMAGGAGNDYFVASQGGISNFYGDAINDPSDTGADIFQFQVGSGIVIVRDFQIGEDLIDLGPGGSLTDLAAISDNPNGAQLRFNNNDKMNLLGIEASQLSDMDLLA